MAHLLTPGWTAATCADLYRLASPARAAVGDGALAAALQLTTEHVRSREQFGRPLATFQAVAQQIADVSCGRADATPGHPVRLLAAGHRTRRRPPTLDVAGYWLAEHGPPAVRTCHHLHGGLGMDVTYPLPRYSALVTDLVGFIGGAEFRLDALAARVCD